MRVLIVSRHGGRFEAWTTALRGAGIEVLAAAPTRPELNRALRGGAPDVVVVNDEGPAGAPAFAPGAAVRDAVLRQHVGASVAFIVAAPRSRLPELESEPVDDVVDVDATPEEALVRVRRAAAHREPASLELGELVVRPAEAVVLLAGRRVRLTDLQLRLLWHLAVHANRILSGEELSRRVWGNEAPASSRRVDVCFRRLRERLGAYGREYLRSVFGQGYTFAAPEPGPTSPRRPAPTLPQT